MGIIREFREFAVKGNVVDMAVGIIIGGAFGTIVKSLVEDVIMPPVGLLLGGVDFSAIAIPLKRATADSAAVTINIGTFFNNVISFFIVALAVFLLVKGMNALRRQVEGPGPGAEPAAPPSPPREQVLLEEIRDILKERPRV